MDDPSPEKSPMNKISEPVLHLNGVQLELAEDKLVPVLASVVTDIKVEYQKVTFASGDPPNNDQLPLSAEFWQKQSIFALFDALGMFNDYRQANGQDELSAAFDARYAKLLNTELIDETRKQNTEIIVNALDDLPEHPALRGVDMTGRILGNNAKESIVAMRRMVALLLADNK